MKAHIWIVFLLSLLFSACKKDEKIIPEPTPSSKAPTLQFEFKARMNSDVFVPDGRVYLNYASDSFTVSKFNYYISNIKLIRADGSAYVEPESYHLIQHVEGKTSIQIKGVPEGSFTKVEFLIGVDSLRNVSGAQTGALDRANDMFWDWDQGYIFFKMEGTFNTQSQPITGDYAIHIGGFRGVNSCLQYVTINLPSPIQTKANRKSTVFYNVQIDEVFQNPVPLSFDVYYSSINEKTFKAVSDNYRDMFVVDKIEN